MGWWAVLAAAAWCYWTDAPNFADRSGFSYARILAAKVGYALVAARAVLALLFRNRTWSWVVYAALLPAVGLLIEWLSR